MLSVTKTLKDVKSKLFNGFSFWGFDTDLAFENTLTDLAGDVYREVMYDKIGEVAYTSLKDKDGIFSDMSDEHVYHAEVYLICYYFMVFKEVTRPNSNVEASAFSDDGYSQSVSTTKGKSEFAERKNLYLMRANKLFEMAGYPSDNRMMIQNSIHDGVSSKYRKMSDVYFGGRR